MYPNGITYHSPGLCAALPRGGAFPSDPTLKGLRPMAPGGKREKPLAPP